MNILIVADLITFSGVGNYISSLSQMLSKKGNRVVIASPINDLDLERNNDIIFIPMKKITKSPLSILKNIRIISNIIRKYEIDVIHANHRMISFIVSIYNKFHKHVPIVWTAHTVPYPTSLTKRIFACNGDRSIAISTEAKDFMLKSLKIKENKIDLILNGVDESNLILFSDIEKAAMLEKYQIDNQKKIICMHGRIDLVKGIDLLVEAVNRLSKEEQSQIIILISGKTENNAYFNEIKSLIGKYNLNHLFVFTGWIATRDILGVADLMIAPSRREGCPLNIIEAFFMELPVIHTESVGGGQDFKDVCIGIRSENVDDIVSAIREFLNHEIDYYELTRKARKFAENNCTLDKMTESVLSTYRKAISAHKDV